MSDPREFLLEMNNALISLEEGLHKSTEEEHVNIFVMGLPRSGSTFLSQMIFNNLDVACTNNLMARYWKVPSVGAKLSQIIFGNLKTDSYSSDYGTTKYPWEPHEFSWFWHDLLNINSGNPIIDENDAGKIDWERVHQRIVNLNSSFGLALVHKPMELVGIYMEDFARIFNKGLFIYIDRDPMDVSCSIVQARTDRLDNMNDWWGSYTTKSKFEELKNKSFNIQIAGQVDFLLKMYEKNLKHVPENQLIKTSYYSFCDDPMALLEEIRIKSEILGAKIDITSKPTPFERRKSPRTPEVVDQLEKGFKIIGAR